MSQIPEFHFDFTAVEGLEFVDGSQVLFRQMEAHYNTHIQPKPFIFGADPAKLGANKSVQTIVPEPVTEKSGDLIRVKEDYEIKDGKDLGLKEGAILTGVTEAGVEIFDYLKNYTPGDQIVEGDSGKYDLGRVK